MVELQELEKEFIHFLAAAQITATDWEQLKKDKPGQADELIDVFSDMVYEKILRKIRFLEYRDKKTLNVFQCNEDKMVLLGLRVNENSSLDLTSEDIFRQWNQNNTASVKLIRTEKTYTREREVEVFELLQAGCLITDERLFILLNEMSGAGTE